MLEAKYYDSSRENMDYNLVIGRLVRWIMLLQKLRPDASNEYICTFFLNLAVGLQEAFCGNELSSMAFRPFTMTNCISTTLFGLFWLYPLDNSGGWRSHVCTAFCRGKFGIFAV